MEKPATTDTPHRIIAIRVPLTVFTALHELAERKERTPERQAAYLVRLGIERLRQRGDGEAVADAR